MEIVQTMCKPGNKGGLGEGGCPPRNQVTFRLLAAPGQYLARSGTWHDQVFRYLARSGTWHDQIWYLARSDDYLTD